MLGDILSNDKERDTRAGVKSVTAHNWDNFLPEHTDGPPLIVLMSVYDDWSVVPQVLELLDKSLVSANLSAEILLVDDGSPSIPTGEIFNGVTYNAIVSITLLRLGRNMGHQRAIAVGLAYIEAKRRCRAVVVMDADGEDLPRDIPRLVAAWATTGHIVFARRTARSERLIFRISYRTYQLAYRLLTGAWISFGNFSIVPGHLLPRLVLLSELWNHYAAAVLKSKLPISTISARRGQRLAGRSHMDLVSLVLHGLGAISVHGDVIGVRALLATLAAIMLCLAGIAVVVAVRFTTNLAIPGWASYVVGVLVAILLQALSLSLLFIFVILNSRNYSTVIPRRDYGDYVTSEERVYP